MRGRFVLLVVVSALVLVACKPYDFNNDGLADFAFIGDGGNWYRAGTEAPIWSPGANGEPTPGNYSGSAWRPAIVTGAGTWTIRDLDPIHFPGPAGGWTGPIPVPGDYDGNKVMEPAWYSTATGTWHIQGQEPVDFGIGEDAAPDSNLWADFPTPGDFNGDGATQLAVFRPTDGTFHILGEDSSDPFPLGIPVVADFDGNGTDDLSVYTILTGTWTFADGSALDFGASSDVQLPVPADYSGSGSDEPVVFDDGTGRWLDATGAVLAEDARAAGNSRPSTVRPWTLLDYLRMTMLENCLEDPSWCP